MWKLVSQGCHGANGTAGLITLSFLLPFMENNALALASRSALLFRFGVVLLRSPLFWLLLNTLVFAKLTLLSGNQEVQRQEDSAGYLEQSQQPLGIHMLRARRTMGYPFFLRAVRELGVSVPTAQWFVFLLSIGIFYLGLRSLKIPALHAALFSSALLYSNDLLNGGYRFLMADTLGLSCAILTLSLFLMTLGRSRRVHWILLTLSLFVTYQVRPVYLFLVGLVPCLGFICSNSVPLVDKPTGRQRKLTLWVLCGVGPLLLFFSLRLLLVGHFGLVSAGGEDLVGIVGQFLTPELVAEMPESEKAFAANVLETAKGDSETPASLGRPEKWKSPIVSHLSVSQTAVSDQTTLFSVMARKVARRMYGEGRVEMNRHLTALSLAIIARRPQYYACWLLKAFRQCFLHVGQSIVFFWATGMIGVGYLIGQAIAGIRGKPAPRPPLDEDLRGAFFVLINVALLFFVFKSVVVILVAPPCPRYLEAAIFFMPLIPLVWLESLWEKGVLKRVLGD
jgi:hypothetical protein